VTENATCERPPKTPERDETTSRNRSWNLKRVAIIATGWIFVVLGIAGLFLPLLQGILFLLIGLVILSKEYRWAGKLLNRIRSRFPRMATSLAKAHLMSSDLFARMKRVARRINKST
jgi:Flp pilus assembly protein TadB